MAHLDVDSDSTVITSIFIIFFIVVFHNCDILVIDVFALLCIRPSSALTEWFVPLGLKKMKIKAIWA